MNKTFLFISADRANIDFDNFLKYNKIHQLDYFMNKPFNELFTERKGEICECYIKTR